MDWLVLVGAGIMEATWISALAASNQFRRLIPVIVFAMSAVLSFLGLTYALQTIPTGTCYAVWVAIGVSLTVAWAMIRKTEPFRLTTVILIGIIAMCVIGLKVFR